jgi:hypothetical protein
MLCMLGAQLNALQGQKIDLDPAKFTYTYRDYPKDSLPKEYVTYSVSCEFDKAGYAAFSESEIKEGTVLAGWKRLEDKAHLQIQVTLGDIIDTYPNIVVRNEDIKDNTGKVTGIKYFYHLETYFSIVAIAKIKDYQGKLWGEITERSNGFRYVSREFLTSDEATKAYNKEQRDLFREHAPNIKKSKLAVLSRELSDKLGFSVRTGTDALWILDSKAHPETPAHKKAHQTTVEILNKMSPDSALTDIKAALKPVLDYFESLKTKYNKDEKRDRKMRYASFFNKAKIYLYLDDPDAAIQEAEGLIKNDYDVKDGKKLIEAANLLKTLFRKNNTNTRHFSIELDKLEGPK